MTVWIYRNRECNMGMRSATCFGTWAYIAGCMTTWKILLMPMPHHFSGFWSKESKQDYYHLAYGPYYQCFLILLLALYWGYHMFSRHHMSFGEYMAQLFEYSLSARSPLLCPVCFMVALFFFFSFFFLLFCYSKTDDVDRCLVESLCFSRPNVWSGDKVLASVRTTRLLLLNNQLKQ
jgi:hypothetical protein